MKRVTRNPYAGVDWQTYGRYKAQLHSHTTQSDGANSPSDLIDRYHAKAFDILCISDHDHWGPGVVHPDPPYPQPTWPWTDFGRDPSQLGMLAVKGNEYSLIDHVNGFFCDLWTQEDVDNGDWDAQNNNMAWILNEIGNRGGLAQANHPGRYVRSANYWVSLFESFQGHLHSIEVFNQGDKHPEDKERWGTLLTLARSRGESFALWGTSVDDAHSSDQIGPNYNVYLMPDLSEASLRTAMANGAYLFMYDPEGTSTDRHVNGGNGYWSAAPMVNHIDVSLSRIELDPVRTDSIEWFTDANASVGTGEFVDLREDALGTFVRAVLTGDSGAVTYTQPFYLAEGGLIVARIGGVERAVSQVRSGGAGRSVANIRRP